MVPMETSPIKNSKNSTCMEPVRAHCQQMQIGGYC